MGDRPVLVAFGLALGAMLLVALLGEAKPFQYDAAGYWALGARFTADGTSGFSLLNWDDSLRGYSLPLLFLGLQQLNEVLSLSDSMLIKLVNALLFALIAGVLAPALAQVVWPDTRWGIVRRMLLAAALLAFWRGYLAFPLSDFMALAVGLLALVVASRDGPAWLLGAGAATSLAINLRPGYLPLLVLVPLLIVVRPSGLRAGKRAFALGTAAFLLGFVAVALPQSLATHRHHETWSPVPGAPAKLTSFQLGAGLQLQRYDTFVGGAGETPRMLFSDPTGTRLLAEEGGSIDGFRGYLGVALESPVAVARSIAQHVINGLDQRYPTAYVETLDPTLGPLSRVAGFLLVFVAGLRLAWTGLRRRLGAARWRYLAALGLCAATSLPSAVETRFLVPVWLACVLIVLAPGWPDLRDPAVRRAVSLPAVGVSALALVAFLAVVITVVSGATDNLTLNNNG